MTHGGRLFRTVLLTVPLLVLSVTLSATALAQGAPLPALNLRAEVRWVDASQLSSRAVGGAGSVIIGTGGVVSGDAQVTLRASGRETEGEVLQQVLVLNGGSARVRLSQAVPLQWVEGLQGPRGRVGVLRQTWVEAATGVVLRPRWSGGDALVELDVTAETPVAATEGSVLARETGSAPARETIGTQVLVPLGEWVTLARSGAQRDVRERGTLSTRDVERSTQRDLQVRISRP
jgi:hypothetical protein